MIRQNLRAYLANEDVLQLPRLLGLLDEQKLVDVSEARISYHPRDLPKIYVSIGSETSEETSNNFNKISREATLVISVFINRFDPMFRPYRSYYFEENLEVSGGAYNENTKDQLRVDLEEISQEMEYRLRRDDPVAYVQGLTSFTLNSVEFKVDDTTSPVTGIVTHSYQIGYFQ